MTTTTAPTVEQIAEEAAALFLKTSDFKEVANLMDRYEAQGVSRATCIEAANLVSELLRNNVARQTQ